MTEALHSPEQKLSGALKGIPPDQYGPAYADHVLEIYKIYLEMADRISSRREKANSFFLAVNAALIALLANGRLVGSDVTPRTLELLVPISAGILCYLWYRIIRSYRDLNSAKFKVIHAIELELPLRPYDAEWESVGRGKNSKLYLPFTHVEAVVPWLFMSLYAILVASRIPWAAIWTAVRGIG